MVIELVVASATSCPAARAAHTSGMIGSSTPNDGGAAKRILMRPSLLPPGAGEGPTAQPSNPWYCITCLTLV